MNNHDNHNRANAVGNKSKPARLGAQLWTVRNQLNEDFEGTLAKIAKLGYREIEMAGYHNHKPKAIKKILDRLGLVAIGNHVQLDDLRHRLNQVIKDTKSLGATYVILAWLGEAERKPLEKYYKLAALMNKVGKKCSRHQLKFAYHNHDFEFEKTEGKIPFEVLLEQTEPVNVEFEIDFYWTIKGGAQPLQYLKQYPGRFTLCHLKDMDDSPQKFFADVGRGTIQWEPIFKAAAETGMKYYVVEHDEAPDPFKSLENSFKYIRQ
jgi:sugar phosphate isomerase/epimerase